MDDSNQIDVPPSFLALFTSPSGQRLTQPVQVVRERYELCEDLAQLLAEQAAAAQFRSGGSQQEVLAGMRRVLQDPATALQPLESPWILTRMAEILGWDPPEQARG